MWGAGLGAGASPQCPSHRDVCKHVLSFEGLFGCQTPGSSHPAKHPKFTAAFRIDRLLCPRSWALVGAPQPWGCTHFTASAESQPCSIKIISRLSAVWLLFPALRACSQAAAAEPSICWGPGPKPTAPPWPPFPGTGASLRVSGVCRVLQPSRDPAVNMGDPENLVFPLHTLL